MFEMPIDGDASRTKWVLMKGSGDYILGDFDGKRFAPETEPIRTAWGSGYYGAQTFSVAPEGRRIQMAWMHMGKEASPDSYPGMPFNHQMSFPREFTLRTTADGPRIFSYPVREIEQLHAKTMTMPAGTLTPGKNALEGVTDELLDIDAEIELGDAKEVNLSLHGIEMRYDVKNAKLHAWGIAFALKAPDGKLTLRILVDRASIELFGNGGEMHASRVFVGNVRDRHVSLTVAGGNATIRRLIVHGLKSIWN
jgi:sucrose-6-phosphate hydrolase SacC (GH32 family)